MKLIESSSGKEGELPAAETCALDEGEDEDQFDAVQFKKKGNKFFSKFKPTTRKEKVSVFFITFHKLYSLAKRFKISPRNNLKQFCKSPFVSIESICFFIHITCLSGFSGLTRLHQLRISLSEQAVEIIHTCCK